MFTLSRNPAMDTFFPTEPLCPREEHPDPTKAVKSG